MNTQIENSNVTVGNTNVASTAAANEAFLAQFKADTGWDYSDAVEAAIEHRTENRLFGNRRGQVVRVRRETAEQKFQRVTGWSFGDAVDMACELQRENRIFGGRQLN